MIYRFIMKEMYKSSFDERDLELGILGWMPYVQVR